MKSRVRCFCFLIALTSATFVFWNCSPRSPSYKGRSAWAWEMEIRNWKPVVWGWCNKTGRWALWHRQAPRWEAWFERFSNAEEWPKMPLLQGDPDAVPILIQLMNARETNARLIAAQGLEYIGEKAIAAVPTLVLSLHDNEKTVRAQAAQALFRIDREAAERAGVKWSRWGGLAHNGQFFDLF